MWIIKGNLRILMNKKRFIVLFFAVILNLNSTVFSQSKEWVEYLKLQDSAIHLYNSKKYNEAKIFYGKMWSIKNKFYYKYDLYWYVCCMAYTRDTIEIEPYLLELVQENGFEYKYISESGVYELLHTQPYWNKIDSIAKINDNNKNYTFIDSLAVMAKADQDIRLVRESARKDTTVTKQEIDSILYLMLDIDAINVAKLKELIALYGFPTWRLVGWEGAENAWLIAQHSPIDFREYYLEQYEQAVEDNNASIKRYAFLIDRVRLLRGMPQLYGTQWVVAWSKLQFVEDIEHLNDRRETVLLTPLDLSKITVSDSFPYKY